MEEEDHSVKLESVPTLFTSHIKYFELVTSFVKSIKTGDLDFKIGGSCIVQQNRSTKPEFVVMAPNITCLYPHEGNCQEFVVGPNGAAPIQQGQWQGVQYYKRRVISKESNGGNCKR